jgi:iron complex outermembrane receptor protein
MKSKYLKTTALVALTLAPALLCATPVLAQNAQIGEIIVTARKRQESILNVPVVETAIPQQQLERLQTQDLKDIATLVPGLVLGSSVLSVGTQVSIRGVGTSALDPGVDAAVALVIDGLQLTQGLAYTAGMFDTGQVEVLKGPQSLFYGKTSTGGVVSIRSADPTDKVEVIARAGYEFEADEQRGELIVSGPVADNLKMRLSGAAYKQQGFYNNIARGNPAQGGLDPRYSRIEHAHGYMLRFTTLWNPTSTFDARLKLNQTRDVIIDPGTKQYTLCPDGTGPVLGVQALNPNDGCTKDMNASIVDLDPKAFPGVIHNGTPYIDTTQTYGTLEMNYKITPQLTLTSETAYYLVHNRALYNASQSGYAATILAAENGFHRREDTQEFRLNSDFAGPLNFTAGAFIERGKFDNLFTGVGNNTLTIPGTSIHYPALLQKGQKAVKINTESLFGQLRYKITPQVEVTAGARWTDEKRTQVATNLISGTPVLINMPVPEIHAKNVSPELTITYKPTDDMTIFGALKKGYKSGSFNVGVSAPATGEHNEFGDEKVQGGEIGLKSRWVDRRLLFNIAFYDYKYTGLQVGTNLPTVGGIPSTVTLNAGSAKVYGVESDVSYMPEAVPGLDLNATVNWNHGRYTTLDHVPCYGGQLISQGCNELPNPTTGAFTSQDRSGVPLFRAPDWEATFGFNYERKVDDWTVIFTSSNQYSSKYLTDFGYIYYQDAFIKADASITIKAPRDEWEVAFIGKNLNNALTSGNCSNGNGAAALRGGQATGTNALGPAGVDEIGCFMDRGRELWVRFTYKPFN